MEKENFEYVVDLNSSEFRRLSRRAYEGDAEAQYRAGLLLTKNGRREEGREWLQKAVDMGYLRAAVELAEFLQADGEMIRAAKLLETAAGEIPEAKISLANCYMKGLGVRQDPEMVERLLVEAAEDGDGEAKLALARRYKYGDCVPCSFGRAMNWLGRAMEAGCEDAVDRYYAEERLRMQRILEAEELNRRLEQEKEERRKRLEDELERAENGDVNAILSLAERYNTGKDVPKDGQKAQEWYLKAAELGSDVAQYWMGIQADDEVIQLEWIYKAGGQGHAEAQLWLGEYCEDDECYEAAADWYRKAAEQGNPEAQNRLARCYYHGWGVETDLAAAAEWFAKAAAQELAAAQYNMAQCYRYGYGVEKDEDAALQYYRMAANGRYAPACRVLGDYYDGLPLPERNYVTAAGWYHQAARQGDAEAQYKLGTYYDYGWGVDPDELCAVSWYRKAAEQGHAGAQNDLGVCFVDGAGVEKSAAEAVVWFRKAAEQGYVLAQANLADCYCSGIGVEKNLFTAWEWYQKAAERGHEKAAEALKEPWAAPFTGVQWDDPEAVCRLAVRLQEEADIKDAVAAAKCFDIAAQLGHAEAQYHLGLCYGKGIGVQQNAELAAEWYGKAAKGGHAGAQYNLGLCFQNGRGVEKDVTAAIEWYKKAADQGLGKAQFHLGQCYHEGVGVNRDGTKAVEWLEKAAKQGNQDACQLLGKCCEDGFGVNQSKSAADQWYLKAGTLSFADRHLLGGASIGECESQYKLGLRYMEEEPEVGISWLEKAAAAGHRDAMRKLGDYELARKNYDKAKEWYLKSGKENAVLYVDAERGDAEAQFQYAKKQSIASIQNRYYNMAAAQGHVGAKMWIAEEEQKRAKAKMAREKERKAKQKKEREQVRKKEIAKVADPLLTVLLLLLILVQLLTAARALFVPGRFGYIYLGAMVVAQVLAILCYCFMYSPPNWAMRNGWIKVCGSAWGVTALGMAIQLVFRAHRLGGGRIILFVITLCVSLVSMVYFWRLSKKR